MTTSSEGAKMAATGARIEAPVACCEVCVLAVHDKCTPSKKRRNTCMRRALRAAYKGRARAPSCC